MRCLRHLLVPAGVWLFVASPFAAADIRVEDAWVREPPPVATPLAGYMRVVNTGAHARVLVAVRSSRARSVEVHRTEHQHGMAQMRRLRELVIPAAGEVRLEPGGTHLMIFGIDRPPRAGEEIELLLEFADGECRPVRFAVVPSLGTGDMSAQEQLRESD